jgi:hypothetical protein
MAGRDPGCRSLPLGHIVLLNRVANAHAGERADIRVIQQMLGHINLTAAELDTRVTINLLARPTRQRIPPPT